ncbi:BREX-1 system adenine-specific DNA-methyltransferase PglX, partial [Rubripirellula sp.]
WLYQFYISEKKDEVIGKVVKSEDIPAATQLFTPNWIVKYLVQNSLGRQWMATYPDSPLKQQMEFYIEPAEQTQEVQQQLDEITPDSLNPEELTLLDPACGSGHILVEAYDLFKAIYEERGYRARDIPKLILAKNLFGLEIDDRAVQLAGFALLMKARADDLRIFESRIQLNLLSVPEVSESDACQIADALLSSEAADPDSVELNGVRRLMGLFGDANTLGSLIRIPPDLVNLLEDIIAIAESAAKHGGLFDGPDATRLLNICRSARLLSLSYSHVVANPPYMGPKGQNALLKAFARSEFPKAKSDLFAMFLERSSDWLPRGGSKAMVTMHSWMFLSSFEAFRRQLLADNQLVCLAELDNGVMGIAFGTVAAVWRNLSMPAFVSSCCYVTESDIHDGVPIEFPTVNPRLTNISTRELQEIPGNAVGYWIPRPLLKSWEHPTIESKTISDGQNKTADNAKFVRYHWEVRHSDIGPRSHWRLYAKGGPFRRWYGNVEHVVDWSEDARAHYRTDNRCRIIPEYLWDSTGITWSRVSSGRPSFRVLPPDATFDMVGSTVFLQNETELTWILGLLNSPVSELFLELLNPTVDIQIKDVRNIPISPGVVDNVSLSSAVAELIDIHRSDWDQVETSIDFAETPLVRAGEVSFSDSLTHVTNEAGVARARTEELEKDINLILIDLYGLKDALDETLSKSHDCTLRKMTPSDYVEHLISFAVGCFLGRFSLEKEGISYAHWGNEKFGTAPHSAFAQDPDEILPITGHDWFKDDAAGRLESFVATVWPNTSLDDNLDAIAAHLRPKRGESARDTLCRYLVTAFYGKHIALYKKSPVYWCFSSGKLRAFQCLVYMHRYNAATLSRMRTKYVIPLQSRLNSRIEQLSSDIPGATSSNHRKALEQEQRLVVGKAAELRRFEESLHHHAERQIELQLNNSVKQNYALLDDLLSPL